MRVRGVLYPRRDGNAAGWLEVPDRVLGELEESVYKGLSSSRWVPGVQVIESFVATRDKVEKLDLDTSYGNWWVAVKPPRPLSAPTPVVAEFNGSTLTELKLDPSVPVEVAKQGAPEMSKYTRSDVVAAVEEMAADAIAEGITDSWEEAVGAAWEVDGVYQLYKSAPPEPPTQEIAKSYQPQTLRDWAYEAVRRQAEILQLRDFSKSIEDCVGDVLQTEAGSLVYGALMAGPWALTPAAEARSTIRKSADLWDTFGQAMSVAEGWLR